MNPQDETEYAYVAPYRTRYEYRQRTPYKYDTPDREDRFEFNLMRRPIPMGPIEYRIIKFLSSRPYYAFTRQQIIEAVTSDRYPVNEANIDQYIESLRDRLGFFSDYIQTVPHIGYRFKE